MTEFAPRKAKQESLEDRLARERARLEEARAEFRNGLTMDEADVEAWLDGLDSDEDRPLPEVRQARPFGY